MIQDFELSRFIENALKEYYKYKGILFKSRSLKHGQGKYKNLSWYYFGFTDEIREFGIKGIHVMPYVITKKDVEEAIDKGDIRNRYPENVDQDKKTGNFHKVPRNDEYQIVLIMDAKGQNGPRLYEDGSVKNDWYIPAIGSDTSYSNDLPKLMEELKIKIDNMKKNKIHLIK